MRVALDVMGGDHGCDVVVEGARLALQASQAITELYLVGCQEQIERAATRCRLRDPRVRILHASQVLTMEDDPLVGVRRKKDCSLVRTIQALKEGRAEALISTGNTGALVTAATVTLRRLKGVERPAIATVIPAARREFVLIDAGANPECKPLHLVQFAIMGAIYAREILGHKRPRIGVLSNGKEAKKGVELTRETVRLCRLLDWHFLGPIEGHDLFADQVEVVVTDGFVGNIVLKSCEGMGRTIGRVLKRELTASPLRRVGAALAGQAFRHLKERLNPDAYGGAPLLGLNGHVIKAHGSAREQAIMNAIRVSTEAIRHHLNDLIEQEIAAAHERLAQAGRLTPDPVAA